MSRISKMLGGGVARTRKRRLKTRETGVMSGIVAGTKVATAMGWRDVASVQEGDLVMTFDAGLQRVKKASRAPLWDGPTRCPQGFWPLAVPVRVLRNDAPMLLLPRQGVMLESDIAEAQFGDPFALVPAACLEGAHGIERFAPDMELTIITLHFETAQVVFAAHGMLLFCPAESLITGWAEASAAAPDCKILPEAVAHSQVKECMALAA